MTGNNKQIETTLYNPLLGYGGENQLGSFIL